MRTHANKWNLNDGVKEARITMSEFGLEIDKSMGELLTKSGMGADKFKAWGKAVSDGGVEGSKAMAEMVTWLDGIEDSTLKNELAIKVFGTKWEDQGQNLISVFQGIEGAQDKTVENQGLLNDAITDMDADPTVKLKEGFDKMMESLRPLLQKVVEFITAIANWISENPKFAAAIVAIGTVLGVVVGAFMALYPVVQTLISLWPILAGAFAGITAPILGTIAAVVAVIAIFVALVAYWDEVKVYLGVFWEWFKNGWSSMISVVGGWLSSFGKTVSDIWNSLVSTVVNFVTDLFNSIKTIFTNIFSTISSVATNIYNSIKTIFTNIFSTISSIVSNVYNFVKTTFTNIFSTLSSILSNIYNFFKTTFSNIFSTVSSIFSNIFSTVSTVATNIWEKVVSVFSKVTSAITSPFETAKEAVRKAIDTIKGLFNFEFKWPKLKMPTFSIKGSMNPLKWIEEGVPKLSVSWNALGGIFNKPTILNSTQGLQGVGEAGSEAILPLNAKTLGGIGAGIAATMGNDGMSERLDVLAAAINALASRPISVMVDGREIALASFPQTNQLLASDSRTQALFRGERK